MTWLSDIVKGWLEGWRKSGKTFREEVQEKVDKRRNTP